MKQLSIFKKGKDGVNYLPVIVVVIAVLAIAGVGIYLALKSEKEAGNGTTPAEFEVSNLVFNPSEVEVGNPVTISATVKNVGDLEGIYTVELKIDGETQETKKVTLAGGESQTVSFTVTKDTSGTYTIGVNGLQRVLSVLEPATFELTNLTISPTGVEPGATVTISVIVKNIGDLEGGYAVELKIDGVVQQTESVTLDNGSSTSVSFTVIKNVEGIYNIEISGLTGSFEIIKPAPEPIILQGTGDKATTTFVLDKGISIFRMAHDGRSNFAIWLYDAETGERVDLLVNEIGPFSGSTIVGVTGESMQASPGRHLLDIAADGSWEVTIEQPRPIVAPTAPQTFTGRNHSVSPPFTLEEGIATFEMTHDGRSNFAIWLYDKNGYRVDLLVNEIGTYSGSTVVGVTGQIFEASPGIHYLDITADGDWRVAIIQ